MIDNQQHRDAYGEEAVLLRFIVQEDLKHKGTTAHDWLLKTANDLGVPGGSAFHGIAGYGRHGVLHEQHFWELSGLPVEVQFVCSGPQAGKLLDQVGEEQLSVFYVLAPVRFGVVAAEKGGPGE